MSANVLAQPAPDVGTGRSIVFRTRGHTHGPVVRMVSPPDVGEMIKPFAFLDFVNTQAPIGQQGSGWHPHSGIATLSLLIEGQARYAESNGHAGSLEAGDIEWMSAGRGIWHTGTAEPPVKGFQLWIALPAELELAPAFSAFGERSPVRQRGAQEVVRRFRDIYRRRNVDGAGPRGVREHAGPDDLLPGRHR